MNDDSYGGDKARCEKLLRQSAGLPWTIFRPCHIYGLGSQLGCLPRHVRDDQLIARLRRGETISLVGGGHFLQQPIIADDLARLVLAAAVNFPSIGQTYPTAGAEMAESIHYYRLLADELNMPLHVQDLPVAEHLQSNPADRPFLCHRIYDLSPLRDHNLPVPGTSLADGLKRHLKWLVNQASPV